MEKGYEKITYTDEYMCYDIETSKFKNGAIVYSYAVNFMGKTTVVRTMLDFQDYLYEIATEYELGDKRKMIIYVHNLGYEYEFMRAYFDWEENGVFAVGNKHKILYARTNCFEFRCTQMLTNMSLAKVGEEVGVEKLDLDYNIARHHLTPLENKELDYIKADVDILHKLIQTRLTMEDSIADIPLTSTGYIRRVMKKAIRADKRVFKKIKSIKMNKDMYLLSKQAFRGGYVHANAGYTGKTLHDCASFDLGSSYPSSMAQFKYPMSSFTKIDPKLFNEFKNTHATMMRVTVTNYCADTAFPPMSESKCRNIINAEIDNGRIYSAESFDTEINDIDYITIRESDSTCEIVIKELWVAECEYLPKPIVEVLLEYYGKKTSLKDVEEKLVEYGLSKAIINACYGMMASDPIHETMTSDSSGVITFSDIEDCIDEGLYDYNKNNTKRFLSYPWGAYVTAYSRYILLNTIYRLEAMGIEVYYCDTDSIYYQQDDRAMKLFEEVNKEIVERLETAMIEQKIDVELLRPESINGVKYQLGIWEYDGEILMFKTLGAKRYMKRAWSKKKKCYKNSITISGVNKDKGITYIDDNGGFEFFNDRMIIPGEYSGKSIVQHSYDTVEGEMTDYLGNTAEVSQCGFITIYDADYNLKISNEYRNFFEKIQN